MAVQKVKRRGRTMWRARVKRNGVERTAFRSRKDEAVLAEAELLRELTGANGAQPAVVEKEEVPTLEDFSSVFIETYATTNNRASTVREKKRALRRGLLQMLGEKRLDQVGAADVERFKARRKSDGLSNKSINEELAILSKLLDFAVEIGVLEQMPVKIRRLKTQPPPFDFLDFDEADKLLAVCKRLDEPWRRMIPVALLSGLRLGELRGLQWEDVELSGPRLVVRRAADDTGELTPTKSYRVRVVDLPRRAVRFLRNDGTADSPFVFPRAKGGVLRRWECESTSEKNRPGPLTNACELAGVRRVGWHVLRHSYASHLVMRGASIAEVQSLLGHASITMTMRYAHLSPRARKRAVALLDCGKPAVGPQVGPGEAHS